MNQSLAVTQELVLAGERTPEEWAEYCREGERASVNATIEWCRRVYEAKQSLQITFREWADDYYQTYAFQTLGQLARVGERAGWLSDIIRQRPVSNDWGALYKLTTLSDDQIAQIEGPINQTTLQQFKSSLKQGKRASFAPGSLTGTDDHLVLCGDCLDLFPEIPDESVDLIATDPPYNINKAYWDSYGNGEEFAAWAAGWLAECRRVLRPHGALYVFGVNRMLSHLQHWLDDHMVYRNWIVWDTIQGTGGGLWTNRYESILYYSKTGTTYEDTEAVKLERHEENIREYNGKTYQFKNPSNVWRFPVVDAQHRDRTAHVTQKPVELMQRIIRASSPPDGVVLDPFAGSGTTVIAARREGRKAVGFELDEQNHQIALSRLNNEVSG